MGIRRSVVEYSPVAAFRVDEGGQSRAPWQMRIRFYETWVGDPFITYMAIVYRKGKGLERTRGFGRGRWRRLPARTCAYTELSATATRQLVRTMPENRRLLNKPGNSAVLF